MKVEASSATLRKPGDPALVVANEVFTLQSYDIEANWPWIERFLEMVEATWKTEDIKTDLLAGRAQLWGIQRDTVPWGIVVTKLGTVGNRACGNIWIAAGDGLDAGLSLLVEHIEPWFRSKGCEFVEVVGRKGWGRVLPEYRETGRIFVKDLR